MKRISVLLLLAACMLAAAAPVFAAAPSGVSRVIPLGTAIDHGRVVQGFAFIHGRAGAAKPATKTPTLYTYLAKGAKWRSTEDYVVNAANGDGASASLILGAMGDSVSTWEAGASADIFGSGSLTSSALQSDWVAPDGVNEAYFSSTELDSGTVAVTIVWGYFGGAPSTREIFEWDMVFNDALEEPWGDATVATGDWDVLNIATHEMGHSAGMGDLYTTAAIEQTMYGYASPGETKKRSLASGDLAGVLALYK